MEQTVRHCQSGRASYKHSWLSSKEGSPYLFSQVFGVGFHCSMLRSRSMLLQVALVEAMGAALRAISSCDARGFFEHRGYHLLAQPL